MRAAPDDEFKLRFPVAKDRTLRRIAILRIVLTLSLPIFFLIIRFSHPAMMMRYGCGAVRAQAKARRSVRVSSW